MSIERIVMAFAGIMIMLTLALGTEGSPIFHHALTGIGSPPLSVSTYCNHLSQASAH